ncbi:uncharacterized protein LOC119603190 [Lucilia sericata]|uniref:uncharacterized protein LOC119603190 n=1 Tax=Lucilia sericata TaxID=13632 RepID=UPI0018A844E6|nr:uncharacterized protein LOC119603190 [Lucilia sericata]
MLKSSWAYTLKRDELSSYLNEFKLDTVGTVEELRKRLAKFISAEHDEDKTKRLLEIQLTHEQNSLALPGSRNGTTPSPVKIELNHPVSQPSVAVSVPACDTDNIKTNLIEYVRKWGLSYDGGREPLAFIERIEELAEIYNVPLNQFPRIMPEFLRDRALIWFRNNNGHWQVWRSFKSDFLSFFLPSRYFEKLEDEIRKRIQRPREVFKNYVLSIQNLMRHSNLSEEQKLQRIFQNALPDYQWYIKRKDFSSLAELITLAEDLESIPSTHSQTRVENPRALASTTIGPENNCYRCGNPGHYAASCSSNYNNRSGNASGGRRN